MKKWNISKYYLIFITFSFFVNVYAGEPINIKENCKQQYDHMQFIKNFLYKFDGNLLKIDEGKVTYIERKLTTFRDHDLAKDVRSAAFKDIFYDPDYIQWSVQSEARKLLSLINDFEKLENIYGADELNFHHLIENDGSKKKELGSAYRRIRIALNIADDTYEFLSNLEEAVQRADAIGSEDIFARSLPLRDREQYGFEMSFLRHSAMALPQCWVDELEMSTKR
jgi:hypothetical protein